MAATLLSEIYADSGDTEAARAVLETSLQQTEDSAVEAALRELDAQGR